MNHALRLFFSGLLLLPGVLTQGQTDILPATTISFIHEGQEIQAFYFSNQPLTQENRNITRAVIVVHGTLRNGDVYFENMKRALDMRPDLVDSTLIIAPQFITAEEVDYHALEACFPYWSSSGWASGSTSRNEPPYDIRISSFEVLDTLIERVVRQFPLIKNLVFTGHSAGGQLANAYTASSPIFSELCTTYGINSKSIVANPGKYVFMTPRRRTGSSTSEFDENITGCDDYNAWSFGLEDLFVYPERSGEDQIREWMGSREVTYLLGDQDTDPDDTLTSCRAKAQGVNRYERGIIYFNHLVDTYGPGIRDRHRIVEVNGVGHDHLEMYTSEPGLSELFDELPKGECTRLTTATKQVISDGMVIFPNPVKDKLFIELPDQISASVFIRLVNMAGQTVEAVKIGTEREFVLPVDHLPPGAYLLSVSDGNNQWVQEVMKL